MFLFPVLTGGMAFGQTSYTWQQVRDRFERSNPTLRASSLGIEEARAQEVTAFLRPNPDVSVSLDQFAPFGGSPYRPLSGVSTVSSVTYLHERNHKRELRRESAEKATGIAVSQEADLTRMLTFTLRQQFVQVLQARAVMDVAKENLAQFERSLDLNRERKKAGDISQVDLDRLELQRVQFVSDLQMADVNIRTAKIQLLTLLNDRTPIKDFDVTGDFDFREQLTPLEEVRQIALQARPDLQAAVQLVEKARTDLRLANANGSSDLTFGVDYGRNPPNYNFLGASVSFPLRIFDRNQGERARAELDIRRQDRLREVAEAQVFSDVDSAYATLNNTVTLLRPYKAEYLPRAEHVRDTIEYAYRNGAASLLDFLQAQQDYRALRVSYLNLIGSYLSAASQLNMAVGREAIQ